MLLGDLVAGLHGRFDPDAAMADVAELCRHDRFQASAGLAAAADHVAERAVAAGLTGVEVLRFPADGQRHWWTYHSPAGWTPESATVHLDGRAVLSYPEQPYALAANSAARNENCRLVPWSTMDDIAGALLVLDDPAVPAGLAAARAAEGGALGLVADPLGRPGVSGRIELPPGSGIAAFSATPDQLETLALAAKQGRTATVVVRLAPSEVMPVVTGLLPGEAEEELLLSAHLCHPRPSANDNASGVAALLGIARLLRPGAGAGVRFLWGPEFVGTAAYLHDRVHNGASPVPALAVNIDMAGEDQRQCGGPLVIERAPDELPSFASALAERCAALLPPAARSYSGAVPCDPWSYRAMPHLGASDHALLVARPTGTPAIGLGHWPDRFNHTSADTLDKVDPAELRRTATIAAATVAAVRQAPADPELGADLVRATVSWSIGRLTALPPAGHEPAGPGVLDPWSVPAAARRLRHRSTVALGSLWSLAGLLGSAVRPALATVAAVRDALGREPVTPGPPGPVLRPAWEGPFNLRALAAAAPPEHRTWLDTRIAADRGGSYARMHALARGLDGERDVREAAWWAALASELPVTESFAAAFTDILLAAGWATPAGPDERGRR